MIFLQDISLAINQRIVTVFPKPYVIYREMALEDKFKRPSIYIDPLAFEMKPANRHTLKVDAAFSIVCFPAVNEFQVSENEELINMQQKIARLFYKTALSVQDRMLTISVAAGEIFADAATVTLETTFFTPNFKEESVESMTNIYTQIRRK